MTANGQRLPRGFTILRGEHNGMVQREGIEIPGEGTHLAGVRVVLSYAMGVEPDRNEQ